MRLKFIVLALLFSFTQFFCGAENIVIKSPGYFKDPIRDGHVLFPDSLVFSHDAEEITIPDVGIFGRINRTMFPKLKKITFGNVDYIPGALLSDMPELEEVVFNGMIGHFDCTLISDCPKLRTIVFKGPISSTGGSGRVMSSASRSSGNVAGTCTEFGVHLYIFCIDSFR